MGFLAAYAIMAVIVFALMWWRTDWARDVDRVTVKGREAPSWAAIVVLALVAVVWPVGVVWVVKWD